MKEEFQKLKITARLQSAVITDGYKPLDAIIYSQFVRDKLGVQHMSKSKESAVPICTVGGLPIMKVNSSNEEWFYACSFAQWSADAKMAVSIRTRRFDIANMMKYSKQFKKVEIRKGMYKNALLTDHIISAPFVCWYAVADKQKLESYLAFVNHIGKKATGKVASWQLQEVDYDWSIRGRQDNRLMRAVPIRKQNTPVYGIRPSYYIQKHQTKVILPKVSFVE